MLEGNTNFTLSLQSVGKILMVSIYCFNYALKLQGSQVCCCLDVNKMELLTVSLHQILAIRSCEFHFVEINNFNS